MSSQPSNLFSLALSKLQLSVSGKDTYSLHRWVLLKNSISLPLSAPQEHIASSPQPAEQPVCSEDEALVDDGVDSFMFPDADVFLEHPTTDVKASEAEWLNSLLETLGDEDEDFNVDADMIRASPDDDDDDDDSSLLSPLQSPTSSSDDLISQGCYPPPIYPPLSTITYPLSSCSSVTRSCPCRTSHGSHFSPVINSPDDSLPYHDPDDVDELSVPDAVEDMSDNESDIISTPSLGRSSFSISLDTVSPVDPSGRWHRIPHIYSDMDDIYPSFEIDPLPFPSVHHHHHILCNLFQEC